MLERFFHKKESGPPGGGIQFIVVGLGNPGGKYQGTRHNAGFMALDMLAQEQGCRVDRLKFKSLCGETNLAGQKVLLMKPSNFMNRSGESVREAMQFYKIPPERVLVIFDDVSLPAGKMRLRRSGSDGGHNGMKNVIYLAGKDTFPRIKIGVGDRSHPDYALADWVLGHFTPEDQKLILPMLQNAVEAAKMIVAGEMDKAMSQYN